MISSVTKKKSRDDTDDGKTSLTALEMSSSNVAADDLQSPTKEAQSDKKEESTKTGQSNLYIASDGTLLLPNDPIFNGKLKMPSFFYVANTIMRGDWLKLGDYTAWTNTSKDALLAELNNVALTAALILTVEFSVVFLLRDQPWLDAIKTFGFKKATEDDGNILYDCYMVLGIVCLTMTCMAMMYCVLLILVMSEMNERELYDYIRVMGSKMDHGFKMYFAGLILFAVLVGTNIILFCVNTASKIMAYLLSNIPVYIIIVTSFTPAVYNLYKIKLQSQSVTMFGPIVMSAKEVQDLLLVFVVALPHVEHLSIENFTQYIEQQHLTKRGYSASLTQATQQRVTHAVDNVISVFLNHEVTKMTPDQMKRVFRQQWATTPII
eukprot:gb/GEZN01004014.1/.p1 GENE.gb/GEZN01004014.1/~~gb/GEZN01004014.1/.p1  ORF type:complete len:379 (-),score=45.03 gb/GEZN01004014.1/:853-1989(-)